MTRKNVLYRLTGVLMVWLFCALCAFFFLLDTHSPREAARLALVYGTAVPVAAIGILVSVFMLFAGILLIAQGDDLD